MTGPSAPTVVVIGAGVLGVCVAAEAAAAGFEVTLIEREAEPCRGASAASFAWVNAHDKHPHAYAALNELGRTAHAGNRWFHPVSAQFDAQSYPDDGYVDTEAFANAQLGSLHSAGGTARFGVTVSCLKTTTDRACSVQVGLDTGEDLRVDRVIIAAGVDSPVLLAGITEGPGVLGDATGPAGFVLRASTKAKLGTIHASDLLNIRPDGGNRIALQSLALERSLAAKRLPLTREHVWPELRARAVEHNLELNDAGFLEIRAANRPQALDGLPVTGWVAPSVYILLSHSGVTLAPVLAELVVDELRGIRSHELDPFRPDRPYSHLKPPRRTDG
ncbi:FAD-binding oxidoreductase [Agromyces sp. SYSU K20354]|uniref:NAD(P)/FAD-dependent oxidoreductase n=1 Tax=Agromyces cavernae TaxID=2898659 RepID=UPI001E53299C|nr:FAD-binding oxidoreductase [Agromyces cavernae]MCD2442207.1 FAD-binding oxidoreductase [Agromyces cavernae]